MSKKNKSGKKIGRICEIRVMKDGVLADALGISQQALSAMEHSDGIEADLLAQLAEGLAVIPDEIDNSDEEVVSNIINNTFRDNSGAGAIAGVYNGNYTATFNQMDKIVDLYEDIKKLHERLLAAEKTKVVYLEKLLNSTIK